MEGREAVEEKPGGMGVRPGGIPQDAGELIEVVERAAVAPGRSVGDQVEQDGMKKDGAGGAVLDEEADIDVFSGAGGEGVEMGLAFAGAFEGGVEIRFIEGSPGDLAGEGVNGLQGADIGAAEGAIILPEALDQVHVEVGAEVPDPGPFEEDGIPQDDLVGFPGMENVRDGGTAGAGGGGAFPVPGIDPLKKSDVFIKRTICVNRFT